MSNLTEEQKLVRFVKEPAPSYGQHYLVVYKKAGSGWKLRSSHAPGELFKRALFESAGSLIGYTVPSDDHLRYSFEHTYKTHDQLHSFILELTLEYRACDPVALVQRLESDPLRRVADEIDLVLRQRIKSVDWTAVELEQIDLEQVLFQTADFTEGHEVLTGFEKVHRFANLQGLEIRRILVVRQLPEEEIQVSATAVKALREKQIMVLEHGPAATRQDLDIELAERKNGFARREVVADGITKNVVRAFDQVTDNIRTLDDMQRVAGKIPGIRAALSGAATGALPGTAGPALLVGAPASLPASATGGDPATPFEALLNEITTIVGGVPCDPAERRSILALGLHVVAESLRGDDASQEVLDRYADAISGKFSSLITLLSPPQVKLLKRLQDTDRLKKELADHGIG